MRLCLEVGESGLVGLVRLCLEVGETSLVRLCLEVGEPVHRLMRLMRL